MEFESAKKLDLSSSRLLVSTALGTEFCKMLEQEEPIELDGSEEYIRQRLESIQTGKHTEVTVASEREAAYLLRIYKPEMILGSRQKQVNEIVGEIASQLGMPPIMASKDSISDRLVGRDKVAIIITLGDGDKLDKQLSKLPESGILLTIN